MSLPNSKGFNNLIKILSLLAIVLLFAIGFSVYHSDSLQLLVFAFYIFVYIQIPGLLILEKLKLHFEHISAQLIIGFFTGWIESILVYFISDFLGSNILLYAAGPLLSIYYFYLVLVKKDSSVFPLHINYSQLSTAFCIFVALVFAYAMIRTQFIYIDPEYSCYSYMNPDKAYHIGLINSLSHDYPLVSPWIKGRIVNYHIFSEIIYSIPVRLFGLEADFIMLSCCPCLTTYTFCLGTYALFREFCAKSNRAGIYSLLVILANLFLVRSKTASIAFYFAIVNENVLGYAISALMAFLILIRKYCASQNGFLLTKSGLPKLLYITLFIMLITGIKGPIGIVLLCGLWGAFLVGLILKKMNWSSALPLIILSVGFAIIYLTVLGSKGQVTGGGESIFAIGNITNICFWKTSVVTILKKMGMPLALRYGVLFVIFTLFMTTIYFLPYCIGYLREVILVVSGKKDFDFVKVSIYASSFVGLIAMFLLRYSGHSQIYFGFVAAFLAPLIAYWFIEDLEKKQSKTIYNTLLVIMGISLLFTTYGLVSSSINEAKNSIASSNPQREYDYYLSVSNDEYDAMKWIEENTPSDALLATDRYYSVSLDDYDYDDRWDNRFFLYADYANRFCYIAGSGYNLPAKQWTLRKEMIEKNAKLYDPNNSMRGEDARCLGVDYVIVSHRFTNVEDLSNDDYVVCYKNKDITIYEVQ